MGKYYKEVKKADRSGKSPQEICAIFNCDPTKWWEVWAAARLYVEEGGRQYTAEEFIATCAPETPEIVADAFKTFMEEKI